MVPKNPPILKQSPYVTGEEEQEEEEETTISKTVKYLMATKRRNLCIHRIPKYSKTRLIY